jgi:hypothetical protein
MKYTLITPNGKIQLFYILEVAKLYQAKMGGTLIAPDILTEKSSYKTRA